MTPIERILAFLSDPSGKRRAEQDDRIALTHARSQRARDVAGRAQALVVQFRTTQAALSRRPR